MPSNIRGYLTLLEVFYLATVAHWVRKNTTVCLQHNHIYGAPELWKLFNK